MTRGGARRPESQVR